MNGPLAQIIEPGVKIWRNVQGIRWMVLHLLIATLYGVRAAGSSILEIARIKDNIQVGLTDIQEYLDTSEMVGAYGLLEH
jgi:hypothetical protein